MDLTKARDKYKSEDVIIEEEYEEAQTNDYGEESRQTFYEHDPWTTESKDEVSNSHISSFMKSREADAPLIIALPPDSGSSGTGQTSNAFNQFQRDVEVRTCPKSSHLTILERVFNLNRRYWWKRGGNLRI
jgi:hypothetical protein